jgi:hypothetical protein
MMGYINDDVSSVHSSALGGVGFGSAYPQMFSNFTPETWPGWILVVVPMARRAEVADQRALLGNQLLPVSSLILQAVFLTARALAKVESVSVLVWRCSEADQLQPI